MPHVVSKDGTTIAYERTGAGRAVIIVDGALCSRAFGPSAAQSACLADHFTVYTYDRRGRGESSDTQPYAVEREIEDLAALIDAAGGSAFVYGISVGSVLALHAAATLGAALIPKLVMCEPPFSVGNQAKEQFSEEKRQIGGLLAAGQHSEAVFTFMSEIFPPPMLDELRASSDWAVLVSHAPTLAYDYAVLGDGGVPVAVTRTVQMPVLLLAAKESAAYKHTAVEELLKSLPCVELVTTSGESFDPTDEQINSLVRFFTST